MQYSLMY